MHWKKANNYMKIRVALDTVVIVALLDRRDKWHQAAVEVRDALKAVGALVVYLDSVMNEVITVLARRLGEQRRGEQFVALLDQLHSLIPVRKITWLSPQTDRLYPEVLALVRHHNGLLNFHDALISLGCRELDIEYIASFDRDFDHIDWLTRIATSGDIPESVQGQ